MKDVVFGYGSFDDFQNDYREENNTNDLDCIITITSFIVEIHVIQYEIK